MAFDLLRLNGDDLRLRPLENRRERSRSSTMASDSRQPGRAFTIAAAFNGATTFRSEGGHAMKKKMAALALALAGAMSLSACATPTGTGALAGGALGAGTGALIGGSPGAALAGGAIGAGTGALIGNATARPRWHCHRWGFDQFGNRRCLAWMR